MTVSKEEESKLQNYIAKQKEELKKINSEIEF